ncbi:alpha/beta-hydrolase [Sistotremastrum suecicum HHB10207 ss-3]|uniref:Alpha/beta-hydrolase n=1 Tax=Sistotremastrum suecicum HHB10207 ss-3 TaxID=1314776 RepID=A0A165Y7K4_9AGAM|nr:alpha/beta-hydrolase [Sistotremastrum suecicum HHB10207 ss-3]
MDNPAPSSPTSSSSPSPSSPNTRTSIPSSSKFTTKDATTLKENVNANAALTSNLTSDTSNTNTDEREMLRIGRSNGMSLPIIQSLKPPSINVNGKSKAQVLTRHDPPVIRRLGSPSPSPSLSPSARLPTSLTNMAPAPASAPPHLTHLTPIPIPIPAISSDDSISISDELRDALEDNDSLYSPTRRPSPPPSHHHHSSHNRRSNSKSHPRASTSTSTAGTTVTRPPTARLPPSFTPSLRSSTSTRHTGIYPPPRPPRTLLDSLTRTTLPTASITRVPSAHLPSYPHSHSGESASGSDINIGRVGWEQSPPSSTSIESLRSLRQRELDRQPSAQSQPSSQNEPPNRARSRTSTSTSGRSTLNANVSRSARSFSTSTTDQSIFSSLPSPSKWFAPKSSAKPSTSTAKGTASEDKRDKNVDRMLDDSDREDGPEGTRRKYLAPHAPVIFCHGLLGFDTLPLPLLSTLTSSLSSLAPSLAPTLSSSLSVSHWRGIKSVLEEVGVEVLMTRVPATSSIEERAGVLEERVGGVYAGRGVHFVAHSMGGLDCRYLITHLKKRNFKVLSLTTIATPHRGSSFADHFLETVGRERIPTFTSLLDLLPNGGGTGLAFESLTLESMKKFNERTPDVEGVRYVSWGAVCRPGVLDAFRWPHSVIMEKEGPNDGLVSVESSKWGTYLGTLEDVNHLDLIGWVNNTRYKWAEFMGRQINFRPATFYLGVVDYLAREVEGQTRDGGSSRSTSAESSRDGDGSRSTIETSAGDRVSNASASVGERSGTGAGPSADAEEGSVKDADEDKPDMPGVNIEEVERRRSHG